MWKRLDRAIGYSKKISDLSDVAFRIWVHLLPWTDCEGRFSADPIVIKAQCLVRYTYRLEQVQEAITELASVGLLHLYDTGGSDRFLVLHDHGDYNPPGRLKNQRTDWPFPAGVKCKCVGDRRADGVPHGGRPSVSSCLVSSVSSGGSGGAEKPKEPKLPCKLCANSRLYEIILEHERHGRSAMKIACPACDVDAFQNALEAIQDKGWVVPVPEEAPEE